MPTHNGSHRSAAAQTQIPSAPLAGCTGHPSLHSSVQYSRRVFVDVIRDPDATAQRPEHPLDGEDVSYDRQIAVSDQRDAVFLRGGTVDEQALVAALRNGELAGAGLGAIETEPTPRGNPLLAMETVIVTPHSAGTSITSRRRAPVQIGQEAARVLKGSWPMSLANP